MDTFTLVLIIIAIASTGLFVYAAAGKNKSGTHRFTAALIYVFCLIFLLRLYVTVKWQTDPEETLSGFEKGFDSIIHTLQTFSMDEDYTDYTIRGKEVFGRFGPAWAAAYGVIISVLNVVAPVLGGAVLLQILAGIFPAVQLSMHPWKRKFVFSGLNEYSVTLAEDLVRDRNDLKIMYWRKRFPKSRPMILFTDAYPDQESESRSELFDRARALRAICVKTDLAHLPLGWSRSVYYFLMDETEKSNISSLASLLDESGSGRRLFPGGEERFDLKGEKGAEPRTKIFAFCQSDLGVVMINNLTAGKTAGTAPLVRPIRDYVNAAVNLVYQVPLFLPLLTAEGTPHVARAKRAEGAPVMPVPPRQALHVTLIGSGSIAEEVFKAVYWAGQMADVQLYIHVLAQDPEHLEKQLKMKCPELFESCNPASELLRVFPEGDAGIKNPPYALVDGFDRKTDAECIAEYPEEILAKTDYFVVALGSDEKDILVSSMLRRELAARSLRTGSARHAVIAPAIFDDRLAASVTCLSPGTHEPYLIPFCTLSSRFSCRNVFMTDITAQALSAETLYNGKSHSKFMKDEYTYWANLARSVHAPYKLFTMGMITGMEPGKPYEECLRGRRVDLKEQDPVFSWTEHRRWNAYMRSQGFSCPDSKVLERYYKETGSHKELKLKYHPCLVESSLRGIEMPDPKAFFEEGFGRSEYDALDFVSIQVYHMRKSAAAEEETQEGLQQDEYKQWDGPEYDAGTKDLAKHLNPDGTA